MAALDFYGMFDYADGDSDVYEYTSSEWSKLIEALTNNGVPSGAFTTTANGLSLSVAAGTAFINGRYGYNSEAKTIILNACGSNLQRIDRLVLELSTVNRTMELKVVEGVASSVAAAPQLTQSGTVYQLPLYQILITNGSNTALTDERQIAYKNSEIKSQLDYIQEEFEEMRDSGTAVYAVYS